MKNRIWKQVKKTGIVTALTGAVLSGVIQPQLVSGADFLPGQVPFIDQSVFWKDQEKGQAELGIRVRGLNEWLSGRRFSDEDEENAQWDDDLQEIEDPSEDQGETADPPVDEDEWQQEEETEPEIPGDGIEEDGAEMEEEYEYMEELASGETVQPEDEEQEETGTLAQEGATAGGEDLGVEEVDGVEEPAKLTLVTYISEYFLPEIGSLPENMSARQISVRGQNGEDTEITRLECQMEIGKEGADERFFQIPLSLRQEYLFPAEKTSYPVTQEEPLQKDRAGAGTFLLTEENGESLVIAEGISPLLEVEAAVADMELSVTVPDQKMKAGQTIRYQVEIANTGKLTLKDIRLTSSFSCPKIAQYWEAADDLSTEGAGAELTELKAGEKRSFFVLAPLQDEQEKDLEHQVEAEAVVKDRPEEVLKKTASTVNGLEALKADFSVKKTADKETVTPGETVTYQICIVNTGEKTLHSVVGTERFQAEGIEAQFLEQEGVKLNAARTKALIEEIPPGEAVSLQAVVKIPEKMADQKLFNQVTVTSRETGERLMEAAASVTVKGNVTVVPEETISAKQDEESYPSGEEPMARAASTHPKTGDDTEADLWVLLGVTAFVTTLGCIWIWKKYAGIYGKN